ncbi:hypothetical protein [Nocardioides montaniterrae]
MALLVLPAAAFSAPSPSALKGRHVHALADPAKAPKVTSGTYLVDLPAKRATYLRLARTAPGTTLHIGGQLVGRGGSTGEGFGLGLGVRPGSSDCGQAITFRPTQGETAPVLYAATATWTLDTTHPCTTSSTMYLRIAVPDDPADAGRPLQLRIYEEPPLDTTGLSVLTTPSPPTWAPLTPTKPRAVEPAHVVDTAPVVRPGTWSFTIPAGVSDFLAVPLDWGNTLRVQLDTDLPPAASHVDPGLELHVLGPLLDVADTGGLGADTDIGHTSGGTSSGAWSTGAMVSKISYANRNLVDVRVRGASLAGMHYVAIRYDPAGGSAPLDVGLTVHVDQGDADSPLYGRVAGVEPPVARSRLVDGTLPALNVGLAQGPGTDQNAPLVAENDFPWGWVMLVVAGLAAFGLLVIRLHEASVESSKKHYHGKHRGRGHHGHQDHRH